MTRATKFLKAVGSSYLVLVINSLFTLASVPLILRYLSPAEAGIWGVVSQMSGYLAMIDLGTSSSGARLLIDFKDTPASGAYGGMIKAIMAAQMVQAIIILIVGLAMTYALGSLLKIEPAFLGSFYVLWMWQVVFLCVSFVFRIGTQLLIAHQRTDITNYAQAASLLLNFIVFWAGLAGGMKLNSYVLAQAAATLITGVWTILAATTLNLFPPAGAWGKLSKAQFKALFGFGAEMFLVVLGTQLILSSQTFLITRWFGLQASFVWSVMTKLFTLVLQIMQRMIGVSMPAFSEMLVRGEYERLWRRYRSLLDLMILASCYFGLLLALGNSAFVDIWTKGKIQWPASNDWLLGIWLIILAQVCCHNSLIISAKEIRGIKFIYFFEGAAFVATAALISKPYGLSGMLVCSIVCSIVFTFAYGTWRMAKFQRLDFWALIRQWLPIPMRFFAIALPIGLALALITRSSSALRLLGCVVPMCILGLFIAGRFSMPRQLVSEIVEHCPVRARKFARFFFGSTTATKTS